MLMNIRGIQSMTSWGYHMYYNIFVVYDAILEANWLHPSYSSSKDVEGVFKSHQVTNIVCFKLKSRD